MLVCILTIPKAGSWNGKFTGDGNIYARVIRPGRSKEIELDDKSFHYDFGDGWVARINTIRLPAKEANKYRKNSKGFMGYDWMIQSILKNGSIKLEPEVNHAS